MVTESMAVVLHELKHLLELGQVVQVVQYIERGVVHQHVQLVPLDNVLRTCPVNLPLEVVQVVELDSSVVPVEVEVGATWPLGSSLN